MTQIHQFIHEYLPVVIKYSLKFRVPKTFWSATLLFMPFIISQFAQDDALYYLIELANANLDGWISTLAVFLIQLLLIDVHWLGIVIVSLVYAFVCYIKYKEVGLKKSSVPSSKEIVDSLKRVSENEVAKQKNSGKYLENLFLEIGDSKDTIRYQTDSFRMLPRLGMEIFASDFRNLNKRLLKDGFKEIKFDRKLIRTKLKNLGHKNYKKKIDYSINYLSQFRDRIKNSGLSNYKYYSFQYTTEHFIECLESVNKRVIIINESAGQGKTNFITDLVKNLYLKKEIPVFFTVGKKLSASNISQSIVGLTFGESEYSLDACLRILERYCKKNNRFLVFAIDGINENTEPNLFSENIELFIEEVLKYDFVKVIITCRTEYYEYNFKNLEESSFADKIDIISRLRPLNEKKQKRVLFKRYLEEFEITIGNLGEYAFNILVENFLLLRIFCEVNKGKNIEVLFDIYKEQLFEEYLRINIQEYNDKESGDIYGIEGGIKVDEFLNGVVKKMIELKEYSNIPIDDLIKNPDLIPVYKSFLDSNLLIKRDLNESTFGVKEVVNFTFDEFRDFLISKYLIEVFYNESVNEFESFLENQVTKDSQIIEGCSKFLFLQSKKNQDDQLKDIIARQHWYSRALVENIFEVDDKSITNNDIDLVKKSYTSGYYTSREIFLSCIRRADTTKFKKLNINTLLEILVSLSKKELENFLFRFFDNNRYGEISQESLYKYYEKLLAENDFENNPWKHKPFQILIYLFGCGYSNKLLRVGSKCNELFEAYHYRHNDFAEEMLDEVYKSSNSYVKDQIKYFKQRYDNTLQHK